MKKTDHHTNSANDLRKKAEDQLKKSPAPTDSSHSEGDALKLIQELQIHQIELEMQNEEINEAHKAEQEAIDLYDLAPTGYFTLTKDGTILGLNRSGAIKLHKDRNSLKGINFGLFVIDESKEIFYNFLQRIFDTKTKETCEITLFTSGYTPINVILTGIIRRNEDKCLISSINITTLKQYEANLEFEKELYEDIVNNEPAGIYRIRVFKPEKWWKNGWSSSENPPYRMELASNRFCEILGITREEFEANPEIIADLIYPEDKPDFVRKNEEASKGIISFKWEGRLLIKDKIRWVHLESIPRPIANEEVLWTGILYDITDQKETEISLKESENKYRELVYNSPDAIAIYNNSGIVFINHECLRLMRANSANEIIGKHVIEFVHPDYRQLVRSRMNNLINEGKTLPLAEEKFIRFDGEIIDVEVKPMPILFQNKPAVQLIVRDITDRKKAENEIKKSREDFKDLFDNAPVGYHEIDAEGRILRMNETELNMLGYSHEEIIGQYIWKLNADEIFSANITKEKLQGKQVLSTTYERNFLRKDGTTFKVLEKDRVLYASDGSIAGIRTSVVDINERKKAEEKLQESEEKFRGIFDSSIVGKSLTTIEGKMNVNKAFCKIVGYTQDELSRMNWVDFTYKDDIEYNKKVTESILKGEKEFSHWEKRFIHKNGNIVWVDISTFLIRDHEGKPVHFITEIQDITDRKKAETDLRNSEERFKKAFITNPDSININRMEDGMYVSINHGFTHTMGYEEKEVLGKTSKELTIWNHPDDRMRLINDLKETGIVENRIAQFRTKTGRLIYGMMSASVIELDGISHILSITRDITEIRKTEFALQQSEEIYRNLVSRIPDGVYKSTEEGKFIDVNPAFVKMLGYESKEELMKIDIKSQLYFDISDRESEQLKSQNEAISIIPLKKKDGSKIWTEDHGWYNTDTNGNIITHEGVLRDITERKLAQDALIETEFLLKKTLIESTGLIDETSDNINYGKICDTILEISGAKYVGMNLFDQNGLDFSTVALSGVKENILKVSKYLGFEVLNKKWKFDPIREEKTKNNPITRFESLMELASFSVPNKISRIVEKTFNLGDFFVVKILKNNKSIGDFTLIYPKGKTLRNNELVLLFANQAGLYLERENSARELRESEVKYRYLFANNPQPMYIHDVDSLEFLEVNQAAIDHYGYSKEEFMSMTLKDIRPTEDIPALLAEIKDIRESFKPSGVWKHLKKNGEIIFVEITAVSVNLKGRNARHVMVLDITKRKKAEEALKESEDKYRTMIENSNDLIWTLDQDGNITFFNKVALKLSELKPEDCLGKSFVPLIMSEDLPMLMDIFNKTMNGETCNYELRFQKRDGTILTIFVNTSPIYHDGIIEGVVSFGRDITDSKKAQIELEERMNDLIRFNRLTIDRELKMIELKKEINQLLEETGRGEKYVIVS